MKSDYLVLDLETVVDPTLPPRPKGKDGGEAFPPAPYHQIVVVGAALLDAYHRVKRIWIAGEEKGKDKGKDEFTILAALIGFLNAQFMQKRALTIVSFNGRSFDLPVLVARCLRHGLAWPWYYRQRNVRNRYDLDGHIDLMDMLADHGAAQFYSLDIAARLIGLPGKMDCNGARVEAMIAAGQLEDVRSYCLRDVAQTTALFLRAQLLRSELAPDKYAEALQGLLDVLGQEPRLAPMLSFVDRDRLLRVPGASGMLPFETPPPRDARAA